MNEPRWCPAGQDWALLLKLMVQQQCWRLLKTGHAKKNLDPLAYRRKALPVPSSMPEALRPAPAQPEHAPFALWATWYGVTIARWEPHPHAQVLVPEALAYTEQDLLQALNHALAKSWPEIWR